jgi:hypothetical protein
LQSITAKGRIWIKPSLTAVSNGASHRERNRFGMTEARSIFCSRAARKSSFSALKRGTYARSSIRTDRAAARAIANGL